jgi:hypothetical protein
MMQDKIIENIVKLPKIFHELKSISIYLLLEETGYFGKYNEITEYDILQYLIDNPNYINQWFIWSEDKRVSSGLYLQRNGEGKYEVGHLHSKSDFKIGLFSDIKEACAHFIILEIEEIRKSRLE